MDKARVAEICRKVTITRTPWFSIFSTKATRCCWRSWYQARRVTFETDIKWLKNECQYQGSWNRYQLAKNVCQYQGGEEKNQVGKEKTSLKPNNRHHGLSAHFFRSLIITNFLPHSTHVDKSNSDYLVGYNRDAFFSSLAVGTLCLTTSELGLLLLLIGKRDVLLIACFGIKFKIYHPIWK